MINDFVISFANVNGTGSASANTMFAKSIFRMGIPISPKNMFPSNIQGLPTWYEIRVSEKGYLGRRAGIDLMACLNPQSMARDVASVKPGGYFMYDSTKNLHPVPMMEICMREYSDPRQRLLFKNLIYVGALALLLDVDLDVVKNVIADEFRKKPKLIEPNVHAMQLGVNYAQEHFNYPLNIRVERRDLVRDSILITGNSACGLGAVYAGATVAAWYPITPSTSLVGAFEKFANRLRVDKETGEKKVAIVQAEDELAAIGMVLGANWNGARSFTATSGPGISLMNEFLGLAYFAEIPTVLVDVQRTGPSTGMPTRTQQSDVLLCAYASHGDTKHPLLLPSTPKECFDMMADSFDLAEQLQTPVIVMIDLDLGMNDHMSAPFSWNENRAYNRGKVLSADELDNVHDWGRYKDVDGDGIAYRTIPATHPTKGSFFTRGSSRDEYARYTEDGAAYVRNMERLLVKWETAKSMVHKAELYQEKNNSDTGIIFFGTTTDSALEALDSLKEHNITLDAMRIRAFPFGDEVAKFIEEHETIFVVEQNRDAQMRTLLVNELEVNPAKLKKVLNYDGMPITAEMITTRIISSITTESEMSASS
jgi:2-oxoglutarate ferredoxin oxidoreductase subunit alpha